MSASQERSVRVRNLVIGALVLVLVGAAVVVWLRGRRTLPEPPPPAELSSMPGDESTAVEPPLVDDRIRRWTARIGSSPAWPGDLTAGGSCEEIEQELGRVCAAIDVQFPELKQGGGSCTLIRELGPELASRPPDLASELASYDTLLDNVFHLFRIAGRQRLGAMHSVLADADLAEPAAMALYRWARAQDECKPVGTEGIDDRARYAYAGFLFNTFGGQAYLRRRTPRVEALVCFYALTELDRSIRDGYNPQGIDPRREIVRCRELVVSQPLVFGDRYAESLDEMSRRWDRRR